MAAAYGIWQCLPVESDHSLWNIAVHKRVPYGILPMGLKFFHGVGHGHGDAAQRGVDMAPLVRCSASFQITWDISSGRSENRSPVDPRALVQIAR